MRDASVPVSRDEIIDIATRLFVEKGYAGTTMSDIAAAVGLHQSSLYYWFRRKELILQAAVDANRGPLEFIDRIAEGPGSAVLKLYRFIRYDTYRMCVAPVDANEIERLAEIQPNEFASFWDDKQRLHEIVAALVRAAITDGQFRPVDADLVALLIVSFDEGVQKRVRYQDRHKPGRRHRFTHPLYEAVAVAEATADVLIRGWLVRPSSVTVLAKQAAALDPLG